MFNCGVLRAPRPGNGRLGRRSASCLTPATTAGYNLPMFIAAASVREWERRYGAPSVREREQTISRDEMDMVLGSRKHGRSHDITMFIFAGERLALIAKHSFPPGGFRAPSGGLEPGEALERGAPREAKEETGLDVALEHYVLRIEAVFTEGHRTQPWVSHVFTARRVGGQLDPIDRHEIARATYATLVELQGRIRDVLLATRRPLLRYRVYLTDETVAAMQGLAATAGAHQEALRRGQGRPRG